MAPDNSFPRVLLVACTCPSPERPHQAVFIQTRAQQLAEAGCRVRVFTRRHITMGTYLREWSRIIEYYRTPSNFHYNWDGIPVDGRCIHLRFPLNYSRSATRLTLSAIRDPLYSLYKKFPFDLMYMATWGDFSLAAANVAKELGVPYVASAIGNYVNRFYNKPKSLPYRTQRELYEGSKLVLCVSDDLNKKVGVMTDNLVPTLTWTSGIDTRHFAYSKKRRHQCRKKLGIVTDEIIFTFVGRLVKEKGIYELFSAFAVVAEENPKARLLLVGHTSDKRHILSVLKKQGIGKKVQLVDGIPATEVVYFLNATDIFVLPSWHEGLPNVIKEASACSLPIISTNVGGIPDVIRNGVNGVLVPSHDPTALIDAMRKLAINPLLCSKMGEAAREQILAKFDSNKTGQRQLAIFKKIIAESHQHL